MVLSFRIIFWQLHLTKKIPMIECLGAPSNLNGASSFCRTDNEVKNAWYTQLKRAERKQKERDLAAQPRFAMASSIESNELSTNQKQRARSATSGLDTEGDSARSRSAPLGRGANRRSTAWDLNQVLIITVKERRCVVFVRNQDWRI